MLHELRAIARALRRYLVGLEKKRDAFGPGFYLYLGTRRGIKLDIENRFVNLVFGLEAFHRRKYPPSSETKLDAKIERIVAEVSRAKDKKWLADVLDRAKDPPPLGQRLYVTLREVPLGLDETRLKNFCEVCGKLRNDISHFGGQRQTLRPTTILSLISKARARLSRPSIRLYCFKKSASTPRSSKHGCSTALGSFPTNTIP